MKTLFFALFFFALSLSMRAQTLYFCEGVDEKGNPVNPASRFTIPENGGYLDCLVKLDNEKIRSDYIDFYIYLVDTITGAETYDNVIHLDTDYEWTYMWKQIVFYRAGLYNVYVTDDQDMDVCSAQVKIVK